MNEQKFNKFTKFSFLISAFIFFIVLIININKELWNDEIYTLVHFVFVPIQTTFIDYHSTNNHIFFNVINSLYLSALGIHSLDILLQYPYIIRLIPLFYTLICSVFVFKTAKTVFGKKEALLALVIMFTSLAFTNHALQVRGYSQTLMFCSIIMFYHFKYLVSARKPQFLRYSRQKNAHLRKVNSAFSDFVSLELGAFLSDPEFSCKHYLIKPGKKCLIFIAISSALIIYTILSNLWFVLAALIIALFQKKWKLAASYLLGLIIAFCLYFPVISSFSGNETLNGRDNNPFQIFWFYIPKLFYYIMNHRYLLPIIILSTIYLLYRKYSKQIFLILLFLFLPFFFSFLRMQTPPDRVFLFFIPAISLFTSYCVNYILSRSGKWQPILFPSFILYLNITLIFAVIEVNQRLSLNIEQGIRKQNLIYNYYLCKYNPREIASLCRSKHPLVLFNTEPHDIIYYLEKNKLKSYNANSLDSLQKTSKVIYCISMFPFKAIDSLKVILPDFKMSRQNTEIGYYNLIKCSTY